jgi:stage II sporulation protein M
VLRIIGPSIIAKPDLALFFVEKAIIESMIRKYYLNEWLFFRKKLLPIFVILLLLSILLTCLYYPYYIDHPDRAKIIAPNYGKIPQISIFSKINKFTLIVRLFWKNLIATFLSTVSGLVPFLFLPVLSILGLSIATGVVLSHNELFVKLDKFSLLMTMLPHGIFEFTAIIYASSLGIYLTIQTSKMIIPKFRSKAPALQPLCEKAACSFILIVVPLLVIAAFVEVLVTPKPYAH